VTASKLGSVFAEVGQRLQVRSALNPVLWLCAIATPTCFAAAYVFRNVPEIRGWLIAGGLVPVAVACVGFIGFAIYRPEKLQSEEYQLRHQSLTLIEQKGGLIAVDPASIEAIANPVRPSLPSPRGAE
jgi:hypothetical protein